MILAWTSDGSGTPAISVTIVRSQSVVGWSVNPLPTRAWTPGGSAAKSGERRMIFGLPTDPAASTTTGAVNVRERSRSTSWATTS